MTSINNPQSANSAATPNAPVTQVVVQGTRFDLKGLSTEDGAKLYQALPQDYKLLADQYAQVAKNFERIADVQLPKDMTLQQAIENYKRALTLGGGTLKGNAEPYLQQLDVLCRTLPGYSEMANSLRAAGNAAGFVGTAAGAAYDTAASPFRFLSFLGTVLTEAKGSLTPAISDEQAKAFGSAYAASLFHEGAVRLAMPSSTFFFNHPVAASLGALESLALQSTDLDIPVLKDAWPYIYAAAKWIYSAITHVGDQSGDKALSFAEALAAAKEEISGKKSKTNGWRSIAEASLREDDVEAASKRMVAAEEVAGIATKEIADAVAGNKTVITTDGTPANVNTQGGGASLDKLPGNAAKDRMDRVQTAAGNILGDTGKDLISGNMGAKEYAATAAGASSALWVGNKLTPGGLTNLPKLAGHAVVKTAETSARLAVMGTAGVASGALDGIAMVTGGRQVVKADDAVRGLMRDAVKFEAATQTLAREVEALKAAAPIDTHSLRGKIAGLKHDATLRLKENALKAAEAKLAGAHAGLEPARAHLADVLERKAAHVEQGGLTGARTRFSSWFGSAASAVERAGDEGAKVIAETSEKLIGSSSGKLAVRASRLGGIAVKFGRALPFVGGVLAVSAVATSSSASAQEWNQQTGGDGKDRSYFNQLDYDHQRGAISETDYKLLRAAQIGYMGAGFGGLPALGITEGAQTVLKKLGEGRVALYLPPTIIDTLGEVVATSKAKPQHFTQEELAAAMAGVKAQAHKAARPMVARSVTVGATVQAPDADNFTVAGMKIPSFGIKHLFA